MGMFFGQILAAKPREGGEKFIGNHAERVFVFRFQ